MSPISIISAGLLNDIVSILTSPNAVKVTSQLASMISGHWTNFTTRNRQIAYLHLLINRKQSSKTTMPPAYKRLDKDNCVFLFIDHQVHTSHTPSIHF